MATAEEAAQNIGKTALIQLDGGRLWVEVEIVGARQNDGHLEYKVKPVTGEGEAWHEAGNMNLIYNLRKGK